MKDLREIESSLERLQLDFNKQLEALGSDSKEFHNSLIELSSKYPDHKELLQFIVFINDKIETKQSIFSDIIVESFNELVRTKKLLVKKMIADNNIPQLGPVIKEPFYAKWKITNIKDVKLILVSVAIIFITAGVVFTPETFISVLTAMSKVLG